MSTSKGRELAAAAATFAMAGFLWWSNRSLETGRAGDMGPGYMPMLIAILLGLCGFAILVGAVRLGPAGPAAEEERPQLAHLARVLVTVLGSILLFALLVKPAGMALTSFTVALLVSRATTEMSWRQSLLTGIVLAVFSVLLFSLALNLPIPVMPPSWI